MNGKVVLITGATAGIGEAAALELARLGAAVIGVGRSPARCAAARERIQRETGNPAVEFLVADLSAQSQVRRLVARFDSKLDRTSNTFTILGFWLEDEDLGVDQAFAQALAGGFAHFAAFLGVNKLEAAAIREPLLSRCISSY